MGLELHALTKVFEAFTLGPLSITFASGRVHGILGPNGAGKTTLLSVLAIQARATRGYASWSGRPVRWNDQRWKGHIAYVRESPAFYDELTVGQTLDLASRLHRQWDARLAARMASTFSLSPRQRVRALSKGTRIKLGLVAALAHRADLLLLDEPTAGLDPTSRDEFYDTLLALRSERPDLTILVSSHIFDDIQTIADDVLLLWEGQILNYAPRFALEKQWGSVAAAYRGLTAAARRKVSA